jgi:hypothetical protein
VSYRGFNQGRKTAEQLLAELEAKEALKAERADRAARKERRAELTARRAQLLTPGLWRPANWQAELAATDDELERLA